MFENHTELNTGLTWQYIPLADIVTVNTEYATIKDVWPSNACKCGNLVQLDLALNIIAPPGGNTFFRIKDPYKPANNTYCGVGQGGILITTNGTCGGWIGICDLYIHVVYMVHPG